MGYTLIWILSTRDTYHITHSFAALTRSWYDMCHSLIKPISKCNPCNNLLISYCVICPIWILVGPGLTNNSVFSWGVTGRQRIALCNISANMFYVNCIFISLYSLVNNVYMLCQINIYLSNSTTCGLSLSRRFSEKRQMTMNLDLMNSSAC